MWYTKDNMFDRIIYRLLDTDSGTGVSVIRNYRIKRTLPRAPYDEKARNAEVTKWANQRENSYK